MPGEIYTYFADDHQRLELLLDRTFAQPGHIDEKAYAEFRSGLLRHIALEEKILLPALQESRHGIPHPSAAQLRLDHGAFAALVVPPPSSSIRQIFLGILPGHNTSEESADGIYAMCDALPQDRIDAILQRIKNYPAVRVMPYSPKEDILDATRRVVNRAGYDFDKLINGSIP
jgi:hypothetical protein